MTTDPPFFSYYFAEIGVPARLEKYVMMRKRLAQAERQASISYSGKNLTFVVKNMHETGSNTNPVEGEEAGESEGEIGCLLFTRPRP